MSSPTFGPRAVHILVFVLFWVWLGIGIVFFYFSALDDQCSRLILRLVRLICSSDHGETYGLQSYSKPSQYTALVLSRSGIFLFSTSLVSLVPARHTCDSTSGPCNCYRLYGVSSLAIFCVPEPLDSHSGDIARKNSHKFC